MSIFYDFLVYDFLYFLGILEEASSASQFLTAAAQAGFSGLLGSDRRLGCPAEVFTILHGFFGGLKEVVVVVVVAVVVVVVVFFPNVHFQPEPWDERRSPFTHGLNKSPLMFSTVKTHDFPIFLGAESTRLFRWLHGCHCRVHCRLLR